MATNITLNGQTYSIPAEGDFNWGTDLSNYFIAISTAVLQKTGGTFTLTSEVNFGATYGLRSSYIKSQAANPASAGVFRLGNAENISWRNQANNADIALTVNSSDNLAFGGTKVLLSGAVVNADIDAAAAIALTKLAATTASRALVSDASGFVSASSVTATELGYVSGVTSAIQTQISAKLNASFGIVSDTLSYTNQGSDPSAPSAGFINTYTKTAGLFYRTPSNIRQVANLDESQNLTNKTLDNSNIVTVRDDRFTLQDNSDPTKQLQLQLSGITTGTTRFLSAPNVDTEIMGLAGTQTVTGAKTMQNLTVTTNPLDLSVGQLKFPASQNASADANTLDDYEEGSWTPTVIGTGTAGTGTYIVQVGRYTKIGNRVFIFANIQISAHTGTGNITFGGLPFTTLALANGQQALHIGQIDVLSLTASNFPILFCDQGLATMTIQQSPVGGGSATAVAMDTAFTIKFAGSYQV